MSYEIRRARNDEYALITALLRLSDLPCSDIEASLVELYVAIRDEEIIGTLGLEYYGDVALMRSLSVKEEYRTQNIGTSLVEFGCTLAQQRGVEEIYILTTHAKDYFERFGFGVLLRDAVHKSIQQTREFSSLCPCSAVVMKKVLYKG